METTFRYRVMLEPRGFIKVIEFVLAIVAFATTGGYHSISIILMKCGVTTETKNINVPVSYPFNFEETEINAYKCNGTNYEDITFTMRGNFSPTAQWFVFVGVMAFLICIATVIFYIVFEAGVRAKNENLVTVGDLVITVLWTFLWLTAAASWAWGVDQVKEFGGAKAAIVQPGTELQESCSTQGNSCNPSVNPDYGSLNASVAFAFLSVLVWASNVWFVYKETPYHEDQTNLTPNEGMPSQDVPENQH